MAGSRQTFLDEYERWISTNPSDDKDVRPLGKAAALHLSHKPPLSEIAPCLAAGYFSLVEFESPFWKRQAVRFGVWGLRVLAFRGRPMWNDFYMCLWQLSRDPVYVNRLHRHLSHANLIQKQTGAWMVNSVCQQDPEFHKHWHDAVKTHGEVFA